MISPQNAPREIRRNLAQAAFVASLVLLAGCASTTNPSQRSDSGSPAAQSPRERLQALAKRQATIPDTKAQKAPPPPGLDIAALSPLDPASLAPGANATTSFADALAALVPARPEAPSPTPETQPADPGALREYIAGRSALLVGKAAEAINRLESASKLDPGAASVWRELGEAQSLAGRRASAMASYQRALRSGSREPRVLRALGRDAWRAERTQEAAALLAESAQRDLAESGSIWPPAGIDLGQALAKLGYLRASAEAIELSLADPPTQLAQSRERLELGEILRRRSELWTIAGDLWSRLDQPEKATLAWEEAFNAPGSDALGLLSRRVYIETRAGRSANAGLSALDLLANDQGVIDDRLLPLLRYLGTNTELGEAWPKAVAAQGTSQTTPSNRSRLARAAAASTPDAPAAREVLLGALRQSGFEAPLLEALLALREPKDVAGRVSDLIEVVASEPLAADMAARALLFDGRGLDTALTILQNTDTGPSRLLAVAMLDKLGLTTQALTLITRGSFPPALEPASLALRASVGAQSARPELVAASITRLQELSPQSPAARRALAIALDMAQRPTEGLAALSPDLDETARPGVPLLLQAADLAARAQTLPKAQALLERAISIDPFDERPYAPLLGIFTAGNPTDQRVPALARSLRDRVPNSRLIRVLQARELASRSLWAQSESLLLSLMTDNSEDLDALGLLATVWERSVSATPQMSRQGLEWLQARLAKRPDSTPLLAAAARVFAATGKGADAESLLSPTLEKWPITDLARLRESIVRASLNDPERADELAKARLEASPPTPENGFELSQFLQRKGDTGGAIQALRRAFPAQGPMTVENSQRVGAFLAGLKPEALAKADAQAALDLFDLIVSNAVPISPQLLGARLTLLAAAAPDDAVRLADAADDVGRKLPNARSAAYARIIGQLEELDTPGPALSMLRETIRRFAPDNSALQYELFRFTYVKGSAADGMTLARDTQDPQALLQILSERLGPIIDPEDSERNARSEIAYAVGTQMSSIAREQEAEAMYRFTLELQPDHGWAANNLGYLMLEQGRNLDEAERLIEMASQKLPDSESVTDSLAWVRYKKGDLADQLNPDGSVAKQGALTLLARAVTELGGESNPTILDHYADALYRHGKVAEARKMWLQSQSLLNALLQFGQGAPNLAPESPEPPSILRLRSELKAVTQKLEALDAGKKPAIAPTFAEQPPATP